MKENNQWYELMGGKPHRINALEKYEEGKRLLEEALGEGFVILPLSGFAGSTEEYNRLVAKLRVADKALEMASEMYIPFSDKQTNEVANTFKSIAYEALKAIREG